MTEEKCIVHLNGEHLVFFFGDLNGEVVGIISYVVRTPEYHSAPIPAREG